MSLNIRLDRTFPGMGSPLRNDAIFLQTSLAMTGTVQQSWPIPATGTLSFSTTTGKIRMKVYNGGGTTPALTDVLVTASDGTNSVVIGNSMLHPTVAITLLASANQFFEYFFEYLLDSGAGGGASGTLAGGATSFSVKTTMSGTTPTASLDLEICPLI
jgi:hypothetical protein